MQNFNQKRAVLAIFVFTFCLFDCAFGHAYMSSLTIDGTVLAEGDCVRPHPSSKYDYPINSVDRTTGLTSNDMTCGWLPNAAKAANRKCPVNPGSKITVQWHYEMGLGSSDTFIIDPSHRGPCLAYMAKSETGSGNVWFKIFEDGYNTSSKLFCVDKLRANLGKLTFTLPTDITPGNYLLRVELIALHEGFELNGAQPYVHCAEITVSGSGTSNPGNLVAFPGAYTNTDPGIYFDIYTDKITSYPIPGPALYISSGTQVTPVSSTSSSTSKSSTSSSTSKSSTSSSTSKSTSTSSSTSSGKASTSSSTSTSGRTSMSSTGQQSAAGVTTGPNKLCYLPGTPNPKGKVKHNPPICGVNSPKSRCPDGQCCSRYGYCGPILEKDGNYYETIGGVYQQVPFDIAVALYCTNNTGDYRKYPCNSLGSDAIVASTEDYDEGSLASNAMMLTVESNKIIMFLTVLFVIMTILF